MNACNGISVHVLPHLGGWLYRLDIGIVRATDWFPELDTCRLAGMLAFYEAHEVWPHVCWWAPSVRSWVREYGNQSGLPCV